MANMDWEGGWKIAASSIAGVSHIKTGTVCQDAHAYRVLPNGLLIAAVADGAGSASLSDIGAKLAVETALRTLEYLAGASSNPARFFPDEQAVRDTLQTARQAVEMEAQSRDVPARELATTLLVAVASDTQIIGAQIGDGAIVARDANGDVFAITTPPDAEYANATTFLTSPDALQSAQFVHIHKPAASLCLFSDGLQRLALKLPEGTPHAPFFAPLFRFLAEATDPSAANAQLAAFLRSPRIADRADDDLTLLLAAREGTGNREQGTE